MVHEINALPCLDLFAIWCRALPVVSCAHPANIVLCQFYFVNMKQIIYFFNMKQTIYFFNMKQIIYMYFNLKQIIYFFNMKQIIYFFNIVFCAN